MFNDSNVEQKVPVGSEVRMKKIWTSRFPDYHLKTDIFTVVAYQHSYGDGVSEKQYPIGLIKKLNCKCSGCSEDSQNEHDYFYSTEVLELVSSPETIKFNLNSKYAL